MSFEYDISRLSVYYLSCKYALRFSSEDEDMAMPFHPQGIRWLFEARVCERWVSWPWAGTQKWELERIS